MSNPAIRYELHYGDRLVRAYTDRPASIDAMFLQTLARHAKSIAIVEESGELTYEALAQRVEAVAGNLHRLGIRQGERVALLLGNRSEFIVSILACARLGAIVVPINIRHRLPENAFVLQHCAAKVLIHEADQLPHIPTAEQLPHLRYRFVCGGEAAGATPFANLLQPASVAGVSVNEDDTYCILYTSGTTGKPKGAMLTHFGVISSCLHFHYGMGMREGDSTILSVPASHVTGLVANIFAMLRVGGKIVMMTAFKARAFLELASRSRITHSLMVPAMYNLCLLDPEFDRFDLSAWRIGGFGGAPMPEATIVALSKKLPQMTLLNAYGATETTSPTTMMPLDQGLRHPDSVGKVLPCADVRVIDDNGREVPTGQGGELWIAGPMVVPGYWENPEANKANFVSGYWKSGDLGSIDAEGFVRIFDRKKDMINRGGYKIFSAELENELSFHPGIVECAVVGRPDPVLGERVQVFVVAKDRSLTAEDIREFCVSRVSDYKVPDRVTFLTEPLPRNANGKVLKADLRKLVEQEIAAQTKSA